LMEKSACKVKNSVDSGTSVPIAYQVLAIPFCLWRCRDEYWKTAPDL